jgi:hypothetical protein
MHTHCGQLLPGQGGGEYERGGRTTDEKDGKLSVDVVPSHVVQPAIEDLMCGRRLLRDSLHAIAGGERRDISCPPAPQRPYKSDLIRY